MRLRADRRVERREEAVERNSAWAALSAADKIKSLEARRGESKRQLAKLVKLIGKE
jgi:hypothetical protein